MASSDDFFLIKDILKQWISDTNLDNQFILEKLKEEWEQISGKEISSISYPERFYKHILYIKCTHQGIITVIRFNKNDIISEINKKYPQLEIFDIKCFI